MIGLVGGSGDFGQGLAERLRRAGEEVVIGSRTPRDDFVSNEDAALGSALVFLCVPPEGVEPTARALAAALAGRIVVSAASPVVFRDGRRQPTSERCPWPSSPSGRPRRHGSCPRSRP